MPARRASRVRHALARLGTLAEDAARAGGERWSKGMGEVTLESARELQELGLDRAMGIAQDAFACAPGGDGRPRSRWFPVAETAPAATPAAPRSLFALVKPPAASDGRPALDPYARGMHLARSLLRLALLARASADYPAGPAARTVLEPLLRGLLAPDERPVLKGRVLVPLVQRTAFDVAGRGLATIIGTPEPADRTLLAARVRVDSGVDLPSFRYARASCGVPVGPASDRPVLAAAERSLETVLRAALHGLADPFSVVPRRVLVGPLTHVPGGTESGVAWLADGRGRVCAATGGFVASHGFDSKDVEWFVLASPAGRDGVLALEAHLAWSRPRGRASTRVAVQPPADASPRRAVDRREPVLARCGDALLGLARAGLERGLASRGEVADLVQPLADAGFGALAARVARLAREEGAGAVELFGALHLVDVLQEGPRSVERRES